MSSRPAWQQAVLIYAALFACVALAYFFADRPLAAALRPHLKGVEFFPWLTHIVDPLGPLSCIGVTVAAARALARGSLTPLETALLRIGCAILIAWALKEELKWAFGRTWPETWIRASPNPSYFGDGTYGFFPFHGGQGYASFPSGHTAAITAFAGAVWVLSPKFRCVGVALTLAVAIGLLGADYHWLSDIIAGAILGGSTGIAAARLGRGGPAPEELSAEQSRL
jgi:membrane-associated phospholipid phosphatase